MYVKDPKLEAQREFINKMASEYNITYDVAYRYFHDRNGSIEDFPEYCEKYKKKLREGKFGRSRGFPNYVWSEDILPLSKALERGLYNERGVINVFKDPTFQPYPISSLQYAKLLRSRGIPFDTKLIT